VNLTEINSPVDDTDPALSPDGLTLVFASDRPDTLGGRDLYMASRASRASTFGPVVHLIDLSSSEADGEPSLSADGRTLYFASERPGGVGGRDLWYATRSCE
jgi:Tol biopolymer transport system component